MKEAKENAKKMIDDTDQFILITPREGAQTFCKNKAELLSMITAYICMEYNEGVITDDEIDLISKYARKNEDELVEEAISKTDKKEFMEFIKDLLS